MKEIRNMIKETENGLIVSIKISPNSKSNEIIKNENEVKIKITAQPIDGKANKGLIEFEKTFVESVVEDKNKISVTYQNVDENARLVGYETDMDTLKRHITTAIDSGENVILGYTQTDNNNIIINGHEITVVGYKKNNATGKLTFICNDTDDNVSKPIEYTEDYLLPKIHHAALPQSVIKDDLHLVENWVEGMNTYKELKKQAKEVNINNRINTAA
jgi:uncharacterized protein (TIGR00251 family)